METRTVLCVVHADDAQLSLPDGWQCQRACSVPEAGRLLRGSEHRLGLLVIGPRSDLAALTRLVRQHWSLYWVALVAPPLPGAAALTSVLSEFIAAHCHDYCTQPLAAGHLAKVLGHAWGMASLARPGVSPAGSDPIIGTSAAMVQLRAQVRKIGQAGAPVLIWGESGTGKELAAQAIHRHSARARGPFVPINCGAIPASLIQSELFGHARGAFTGAARDKVGLIESAAGGTIFLDEIADLPRELQANLLRFLQEKTIYRIGSTRSVEIDVRVIAASHVELQQAVQAGQFREDLYYRLHVLPLTVPPLRARRDDVCALAEHFFHAYAAEKPARLKGFSQAARQAMREHAWPGNVRELINRVRRAVVLAEGRLVHPADLGLPADPGAAAAHADAAPQLHDSRILAERRAILASLERSGGNVTHAARELAISRMTLYRQMAKHGIAC